MQAMRVPRSTSSSTKGGKGDHTTRDARGGNGRLQHQLKGEWNSASLGEVPVFPSPLVGGAAFLLWVVLLSLRGWRCLLHSGDGVVFPHGQFETVASRQCVKANQATRPVQDGHTGASLTLSVTPPLPHSLPFSASPSLSPLSLPLSFPLYLDCDGDVQSCDNSPTHKIHRVWC